VFLIILVFKQIARYALPHARASGDGQGCGRVVAGLLRQIAPVRVAGIEPQARPLSKMREDGLPRAGANREAAGHSHPESNAPLSFVA
jgi:hypothetical protein